MQNFWSWASCRTTFHSVPCLPTSVSQQSYDHSLSKKNAFSGRSHRVQVEEIPLHAYYTASYFFLMHSDLRCSLSFPPCALICEQDCIKERGSGIQYADNCQRQSSDQSLQKSDCREPFRHSCAHTRWLCTENIQVFECRSY
jgi:hypothetical protein